MVQLFIRRYLTGGDLASGDLVYLAILDDAIAICREYMTSHLGMMFSLLQNTVWNQMYWSFIWLKRKGLVFRIPVQVLLHELSTTKEWKLKSLRKKSMTQAGYLISARIIYNPGIHQTIFLDSNNILFKSRLWSLVISNHFWIQGSHLSTKCVSDHICTPLYLHTLYKWRL